VQNYKFEIVDLYYALKCRLQHQQQRFFNIKNLLTEVQRMWNVKANMKLINIDATGSLSRLFRKSGLLTTYFNLDSLLGLCANSYEHRDSAIR
jgi:hypothetical protein